MTNYIQARIPILLLSLQFKLGTRRKISIEYNPDMQPGIYELEKFAMTSPKLWARLYDGKSWDEVKGAYPNPRNLVAIVGHFCEKGKFDDFSHAFEERRGDKRFWLGTAQFRKNPFAKHYYYCRYPRLELDYPNHEVVSGDKTTLQEEIQVACKYNVSVRQWAMGVLAVVSNFRER